MRACGCIGGCLGSLLLVGIVFMVLLLSVFGASVATQQQQTASTASNGTLSMPLSGPVYPATRSSLNLNNLNNSKLMNKISIHNLGFGPSDANRINRMLEAINPDSPLNGKGSVILKAAQRTHVDPLLIGGIWQLESQLDTHGLNVPGNGGNMTWPAMQEASKLYGCSPGPSSLGHRWGKCPDVDSGIKIWFDYVGHYYVRRHADNFKAFVNTYNPCSDPGNAANGFDCGDGYGTKVLGVIRSNASPPVTLPNTFLADFHIPKAGDSWYRYQGEQDSYNAYNDQNANCGPTSTAMAIEWYTGQRVPISTLRTMIGTHGDTTLMQQSNLLWRYHVPHRLNIANAQDIKAALRRGSIVEVAGNMRSISPGPDANGASDAPDLNRGGYYTASFNHVYIVRGITKDGRYFIVNDPNVWGTSGAKYYYSNGKPKGRDRLYPVSEVNASMEVFGFNVKGMEIPAPSNKAKQPNRKAA